MRRRNWLIGLMLALLLAAPFACAEEEAAEERIVYPICYRETLPSLNEWQPLLEMDGIESYAFQGMLENVDCGGTPVSLFFGSETAEDISTLACTVEDGALPGPGEGLVSAYFAEEANLKPGDALPVAAGENAMNLVVSGVFRPDPDYYTYPEQLSYIVIVSEDVLRSLLDPDATDCFSVDDITLAEGVAMEDFLQEANALMEDASVQVLSEADYRALYEDSSVSAAEGEPLVTEFSGTDLYGQPLPEEILVPGGVTMVNCWGTFCNPCIAEMPDLKLLSDEYAEAGEPFRIVGVCMDTTDFSGQIYEDLVETGKLIVEKTGADYLHIIPGQEMFRELMGKMNAYPTTFFLNDAGEVLGVYVGSRDADDWRAVINEYLP